jgi:hypothetical protein
MQAEYKPNNPGVFYNYRSNSIRLYTREEARKICKRFIFDVRKRDLSKDIIFSTRDWCWEDADKGFLLFIPTKEHCVDIIMREIGLDMSERSYNRIWLLLHEIENETHSMSGQHLYFIKAAILFMNMSEGKNGTGRGGKAAGNAEKRSGRHGIEGIEVERTRSKHRHEAGERDEGSSGGHHERHQDHLDGVRGESAEKQDADNIQHIL